MQFNLICSNHWPDIKHENNKTKNKQLAKNTGVRSGGAN
jgi:hypothetical protein